MKKLKLVAYFFMMATALSVTSCSSDNDTTPEGSTEGDYWPMAVNNQWVFNIDGVDQPAMKIVSTEQISGKTYYKYDNMFGQSTGGLGFEGEVFSRKSGGSYYVRTSVTIPSTDGMPAITVSPLEMIIFKDNLAAGETWTESLTQTTTMTGIPPIVSSVVTLGTIVEKDISLTVGTATYTNVIKSSLQQTSLGTVVTSYYWFAAGVGIVKTQSVSASDGFDTTNELSSYIVN